MGMDHSRCAHPRTPAGRAACRKRGGPNSNLTVNVAPALTLKDPVEAKLAAVRVLARKLMDDHGLHRWTFAWDQSVRRFGQCRYGRQEIGLSRANCVTNSMEVIHDVILHEIAHALVGASHGHDAVWRAKCAEIGLTVTSRFVRTDAAPAGGWHGTCPSGRHTMHRARWHRDMSQTACRKCCDELNGGKYDSRFVITWTRVKGLRPHRPST